MFGDAAFLLNGNMCRGAHGGEVILRVALDQCLTLLACDHVRDST